MPQPMTLVSETAPSDQPLKRNRYPLLNLEFPVCFRLSDADFTIQALQLSHEEVRVACTAADIPLLVPRTAHHRPDEKIVHQTLLHLDDAPLEAQLQVQVCRRHSQQEFHVTFRILELNTPSQIRLEAFLQQALQNNASPARLFG